MRIIREMVDGVFRLILCVFEMLLFLGIILYIVFRYSNPANLQPFEMATVTTLLGGFALAGGFSGNARLVSLAFALRGIGALYIASTIAFVLFGLFLPLTEKTLPELLKEIATPVIVFGAYSGAFLFVIATGWILYVIPRIFREH